MTQMTGRERVNRMLARQDQDRIPRGETIWPQTVQRWQHEGLSGDVHTVLDMLQCDFQRIHACFPAPFPNKWDRVAEDEATVTAVNGYGATVRTLKDGSGTPEHVAFDCSCRDVWEKKYKPAMHDGPLGVNLAKARITFTEARRLGRWAYMHGGEAFEFARQIMGDEMAMIAMVENPEWMVDVSRTIADVTLRNYEAVLGAGIDFDGVWLYGDMAYKNATFCSPAMYRQIIWPDHKRIADWAHAHGMKIIFHTDGNVNGVVDLYIEAGFDCLQPLEAKAGMDLRRLVPRWGDRLSFFGNVDVMVMAGNDLARIEEEIKTKLTIGKTTRGYAYHSDHSVPPQVSWMTYRAIIEMVEKYGQYE